MKIIVPPVSHHHLGRHWLQAQGGQIGLEPGAEGALGGGRLFAVLPRAHSPSGGPVGLRGGTGKAQACRAERDCLQSRRPAPVPATATVPTVSASPPPAARRPPPSQAPDATPHSPFPRAQKPSLRPRDLQHPHSTRGAPATGDSKRNRRSCS